MRLDEINGMYCIDDIGRMIFMGNNNRSNARCAKTVPSVCGLCDGIGQDMKPDGSDIKDCPICEGYGWVCHYCGKAECSCDCGNSLDEPKDIDAGNFFKLRPRKKK